MSSRLPTDQVSRPLPLDRVTARDLAFVGDAVYELAVRSHVVLQPGTPGSHHREAVRRVRASAQARSLRMLEGFLSPEEREVVRRARNAKTGSPPRGVSAADYHFSTAFEALLGHLYVRGQQDRLQEILHLVLNSEEAPP